MSQWLTSTRKSSSIGNPSTVFFRSISTDGCRAARPLDLVLIDWDWVTWAWTDPSPNQGEEVCNVIYDIILYNWTAGMPNIYFPTMASREKFSDWLFHTASRSQFLAACGNASLDLENSMPVGHTILIDRVVGQVKNPGYRSGTVPLVNHWI